MNGTKCKKLPVWALILIDLLALAIGLSVFSYFHHIRFLWGSGAMGDAVFRTPQQVAAPMIDPETGLDVSGDFGARFPERFLTGEDVVEYRDEQSVVSYLSENGFLPQGRAEGSEYLGVYRSHDIFMTVEQIDCKLYSEQTGKYYSERYYVFDFYVRNLYNLYTSYSSNRTETQTLLQRADRAYGSFPLAAVNGDYLGNAGQCFLAVRNGFLYRESDFISTDICVLYDDGVMETVSPSDYAWDAMESRGVYQIWNFGPGLLDRNGNALTSFDDSRYGKWVITQRNPRTGIGYYEPGHYCFVVFDGRSSVSDGVTVAQMAQVFADLGCVSAYNMDGGNSSQAYYNPLFLRASDENQEQRDTFDIICVGEYKKRG